MSLKQILSRKNIIIFFFIVFAYAVLVNLAVRYTTGKHGYYNYMSTLWADKSGYYAYLPATFIYGFHADSYPKDIQEKTGYGFTLDYNKNIIVDKYTSGVAILILPFFIIAHLFAMYGGTADGFGPVYQQMINFTGPFYALLGLVFLFGFLKNYVSRFSAISTCILIFVGTNLYYYTVADALMSHVYSFFLFSLTLYSVKRYYQSDFAFKWALPILASSFLIILIRPNDIIFLFILPFIDFENFRKSLKFIISFFTVSKVISAVVLFIIIIGPQMIYWNFAFGSFISYSYGNEGFDYISGPKISEVLFSTNNGLFTYNPIYLLLFLSLIIISLKNKKVGIPILIVILLSVYISASWSCWYYGCSYGMRPMVQYTSLFAIPFALLIEKFFSQKVKLTALLFSALAFSFFSIKMVYAHERCFYGGTWDFIEFNKQLERAGWNKISGRSYFWSDDYENENAAHTGPDRIRIKYDNPASGDFVTSTGNNIQYSAGFSEILSSIVPEPPKEIQIEVKIKNEKNDTSTFIVCDINRGDSVIFWQSKYIRPDAGGCWHTEAFNLSFPYTELTDRIKVYIWNPAGRTTYADDYKVKIIY